MVNTSNVMGVVLLVFGVALAVLSGTSGDRNALVAGFIGSVALLYMGIGLYSRGNTEEGLLRASDETTKRATLYKTTAVVAALAAVVSLVAFMYATLTDASLVVRGVFGGVFVYTVSVAVYLYKNLDTLEDSPTGTTEDTTDAADEADVDTDAA